MDLSKLNNVELLKYINKLTAENKKLNSQLNEVTDLYNQEKIKFRKINEKFNALLQKYELKDEKSRRDLYNKFVTKNEKNKNVINDVEHHSKKLGRKAGGSNFTSSLTPTRTIVIEPEEKVCASCKEALIEIGNDKTIKIVKIPATYEVIEYISKKYVCKEKCENKIYQQYKNDAFGKSPITSSFVADVINNRYNLCVPLDRFSKHLNGLGLNISTHCLSNYVMKSAELLTPLYNALRKELIKNSANVIHVDETTINILDIKDRQNSYIFSYSTSFYDRPVSIYEFSEDRKTDKTNILLKDFKGTLVCDGYSGYNQFKEKGIKLQRCMVHARRYFYDIIKSLTAKERETSKAKQVVDKFDAIFSLEKRLINESKTPEEIVNARNSTKYKIAINNLKENIMSLNPIKGSLLDKAVNYSLNIWDDMFTYLNNPYVDPSNNTAERAIKPFVILRKNILFSKNENGAQATSILMSIIQTLKANGIHPEKYLTYAFDHYQELDSNPADFLPWSDSLPNNLKIKL